MSKGTVLAFVVFSALADSGRAPRLVVTGSVVEFEAREWIAVSNDATGPVGFRITLREKTAYEGLAAIKPGVRVTVWYRSVGERQPVADKVRVGGL